MNAELVMKSLLHIVSQAMLVPVMIVLVLLILVALAYLGSLLVEYFTERRHYKANVSRDINAIFDADYGNVSETIAKTQLLAPQKIALDVVACNMGLTDDDLYALAKAEMAQVDGRYSRMVKRTDLLAKVGPMFGLLGTLIPLGPGIVAMGNGDVETLSNSLLVAFDTTIAGLLVSIVAMCVSTLRKRWYGQYHAAMEALMVSILSKASDAREAGVELPHNVTIEELEQQRRLRRAGVGKDDTKTTKEKVL